MKEREGKREENRVCILLVRLYFNTMFISELLVSLFTSHVPKSVLPQE